MSHSSAELESLNYGITSILEKPFISSTVVLVISWTTFIIFCSLPDIRDVWDGRVAGPLTSGGVTVCGLSYGGHDNVQCGL